MSGQKNMQTGNDLSESSAACLYRKKNYVLIKLV